MTEQGLQAIRRRAHDGAAFLAIGAADARALLAYVAELEGVLHDVQQDGGCELGRRLERDDMLTLLDEYLAGAGQGDPAIRGLQAAIALLSRRSFALMLPTSEVRRENERLRAALQDIVVQAQAWQEHGQGQYPGPVLNAFDEAAKLLRERP